MSDTPSLLLTGLLTTEVPRVSTLQAENIAAQVYGLEGKAEVLGGERDSNFCLTTDPGHAYMLRFVNPAEVPAEVDFQTAILSHLALHDSQLPVPRLLQSRHGELTPQVKVAGQFLTLRAVSYLPGTAQYQVPRTPRLMHELGDALARLDIALRDFEHPGAKRDLLWDISDMSRLEGGITQFTDPEQRRTITRVLETHRQKVVPASQQLRRQVIHNDLNAHNVLVNSADPQRLAGIIDFGDALHAPLINELATALAYQLNSEGDDLFLYCRPMIAAYTGRLPLTGAELDILPELVASRLALSLLIARHRAALYPQNRDYILRNQAHAWGSLSRLMSLPFTQTDLIFRQSCAFEQK
ncbi:phosphotransferase [Rahnella aquatilis]|uniref:Hydroxylysine kinase n=1 Tax=Rahnella aquatilis (strain ATCC 33071 / DSM 4594 / JCM 1683 / NBRC 105701 / NCIMB 13365 / CIP 78.65) TaxID=745277 RepID=H2J1J2_RAHAC|nr:phosphotransferase [Rahnella aquatilis]AEX54439.1 putative homoserine kinase type II (protein kinase fold) [Rahnella aquatilis CIP 78.65 = ATCC 33071]KFC99958.1 putative phosphotransferase [Rahnella aquatilis CIP 78.65 = ATCC 33071]